METATTPGLCMCLATATTTTTTVNHARAGASHEDMSKALVWPYAAYLHFGVKRVWSLGEYSQWADLCAALATLGFEVILFPMNAKVFPTQGLYDSVHIIFTDYNGVHAGKSKKCLPPADKTWLLDTFGTDGTVLQHEFFGRIPPLTNYPLERFLTLVPGYGQRNTFLGVAAVAGRPPASTAESLPGLPPRQWRCVLWSKVQPWLSEKNGFPAYHWQLLREYSKHCQVIATIDRKDTYGSEQAIKDCCPDVEIRDVASPEGFQELLRSSAVYVGVGEPLIAPSCFEALGLGTHVVQPRFPEPRVLKNKPTTQAWTSQHPFLEEVPEPFAFTVDPLDHVALAAVFGRLRANFEAVYGRQATAPGVAPSALAPGDDVPALRRFYATGDHPAREQYAIAGFLKRAARIVRRTQPLRAEDWAWEQQDHPQSLPDVSRPA
ncbi:unnamed protein product [Polarella glacialis]|uniref:alpha-1,6-mannosyl-glycoprotein 6-beta-N-acetylglucosaminyltransferase n=1 Tax=Polarella glacialis TaxID=89957 RepID=A0A813H0V4_POLGL|nr:unnamed protein product [Polarella glacialis]